MLRFLLVLLAGAVSLMTAGCFAFAFDTTEPLPVGPLTPLVVETAAGPAAFSVELADTPERQVRGLMFRTDLPPDRGMLFDFGARQWPSMWMKNTLIPLDMVFIGDDGRIVHIAQAKPLDLTPVGAPAPSRFVLEIAGGRAAALGIRPGDRVIHAVIGGTTEP